MRRLASQIIADSGEFQVAGTARNGYDALKQVHALDPDIVTLDIDMPELDGVNALGYIMSEAPRPVVMLSAGTTLSGQDVTLRTLELGAVDFVLKPSGPISLDLESISGRLLDALRAAAAANPLGLRMLPRPAAERATPAVAPTGQATSIVAIACSTGGPRALAAVIPRLPRTLDAAVLVVQHMPAGFTRSLAHRLDAVSPLAVIEAEEGETVVHRRVYLAPGGYHMRVVNENGCPTIALDDSPPIWGVRPAADRLFRSVAELYGPAVIAVVLTGMGRDAAEGTRMIRSGGGRAIIQDRESATIFGMPQAALQTAGADRVVALDQVASAITEFLSEPRDVS
jgi:two-component system, chemotaxis family, protein-glutamate methylesterase/glutaminase